MKAVLPISSLLSSTLVFFCILVDWLDFGKIYMQICAIFSFVHHTSPLYESKIIPWFLLAVNKRLIQAY